MKLNINDVLSEGYVKGKIVSFKYQENSDEVLSKGREIEKLDIAIGKTKTQLEKMIISNRDLEDYINVLILIATDPELKRNCESRIKIGLSAKASLYDVMNHGYGDKDETAARCLSQQEELLANITAMHTLGNSSKDLAMRLE